MIVPLVIGGAAAILLGYEAFALLTGRKLVTMIVRDAFWAYPPIGFLAGLGSGLLLAHLFWCP